jgi:hypothetical protein
MTTYPTEYTPEDLTVWVLAGNRFIDIDTDHAKHFLWLMHALPHMHECVTIVPMSGDPPYRNYEINVAGQWYMNMAGNVWKNLEYSLPYPMHHYLKKIR